MVDVLSTVAGVALLAFAAVAIACVLRVSGRAAFAAAVLVIAGAIVVLLTIALSIPSALTRAGVLGGELVLAVAAVGGWVASGRPRPDAGWRPRVGEARIAAGAYPAVAVVVGLAVFTLAVQLVMAIAVAPSNWDSMTYHLSRAAYWLQQHSATHFPGGSVRQLGSPPNAEILQAWTLLVTGTDRFVAVVQWLALLGVCGCVIVGARLLAFDRAGALFAAALFAVLPQPVLQATSTQNDLITALFVVAVAVFGVRGVRDRRAGDLAVAAIAAGVAVGTKGTVLALAPSLAIVIGAAVWRYRPPRRLVLGAVAGTLAAVVVFGSWGYVLNVRDGDPLLGGLASKTQRDSPVPENAVRVAWTLADSPGVAAPWVDALATRAADKTIGHLEIPNQFAFGLDTAISEDTSAYGIVGWLALLPLALLFLVARRSGPRREWALAVIVGIAGFAVAFEYNIWVGRLLLPTIALAAPLFAALARRPSIAALAVGVTAATLVPCLVLNPNKQLLVAAGAPKAIQKDRIGQMTVLRPEMAGVLRGVDDRIGTRGALAVVADEDSWDYPFFGAHRERRVVRFSSLASATPGAIRAAGVRGVLFSNLGRPARAFRARQIVPGYWFAPLA